MKTCSGCGETRPLSAFTPDRHSADGHHSRCRGCSRRSTQKWLADPTNRKRAQQRWREWYAEYRAAVFEHYGKNCSCCGSADDLTIDHIAPTTEPHAKRGQSSRGARLYVQLVKDGFPLGYQTLCRRCNDSKNRGTQCRLDHVAERWAVVVARLTLLNVQPDEVARAFDVV